MLARDSHFRSDAREPLLHRAAAVAGASGFGWQSGLSAYSKMTRRSALVLTGAALAASLKSAPDCRIPILVYHRFGPVVADSMTVRTTSFESQLSVIRKLAFRVTPLADVVALVHAPNGVRDSRIIAITADDGHRSVYEVMWPIVEREHLPLTLFIYPSAISNASYALTWEQLREMLRSGLVTIGSHTFWHPNFRNEKKRLAPKAYQSFVKFQLERSKTELEQRLSVPIEFLAWPFGIYDDELIHAAEEAGYTTAFTIERRPVSPSDRLMALPRFLMTDADVGIRLERLICP
jgi:peptidoglycan/xylan/chitin deacetylase (PgdA/CDA1 family)